MPFLLVLWQRLVACLPQYAPALRKLQLQLQQQRRLSGITSFPTALRWHHASPLLSRACLLSAANLSRAPCYLLPATCG